MADWSARSSGGSSHDNPLESDEPAARYAGALDAVAGAVRRERRTKTRGGPFSSPSYRRLFTAQFASSLGDWVGFLAVATLAAQISKSSQDAAVGFVISARLIPGFFFGSVFTTFLDRWDRKKVMVTCDIGRGIVTALIPFVHSVLGLFGVSLVLECLTLMWTPAKEASVPNLVTDDQLAQANSASLAAAYGTIVPAAGIFAGLSTVQNFVSTQKWARHVPFLHSVASRQTLALYLDALTFFVSATLIATLALSRRSNVHLQSQPTLRSMVAEAKEGWRYIASRQKVRSVIIGFCTGLIGGGMVVPLSVTFADNILHAGSTAFGLLQLSLGVGVAASVLTLSLTKRRTPIEVVFARAVIGAGISILVAASMSTLGLTMLFIAGLGICAGAVYVLGFTVLQTDVEDGIRGRIFGVFYVLVRFCLLLAFALAPFISSGLEAASSHSTVRRHGITVHHELALGSWTIAIPGARLTLWLGGAIVVVAGLIARRGMRAASSSRPATGP